MASKYITPWNGVRTEPRIRHRGRWLTKAQALAVARVKVAEDSREARLEAAARFRRLL